MGCISYAWFPFFAASSAIGLGVAKWFYPVFLSGPPLFPLCNYVVAILYLVTILARYIYVDKVQSTFWNAPTTFVGLLAILSYLGRVQLISSRGLVQGYGVEDQLLLYIEEGLECVVPFTTNMYCILQTVVSYKTGGSNRYTGKCMRTYRVLVCVLLTPVAHYLIFTHVTTRIVVVEGFGFLTEYYPYVYWALGGLTSLFILSFASELFHIRSYCGCLIGRATARVTPAGMLVTNTAGGGMMYMSKDGEFVPVIPPVPIPRPEPIPCLSYVWLPILTGFSAIGLHIARFLTDDLLTVTPMFPYLDHAVAALFLITIIVRCAYVRKRSPTCFNGLAIIFGLLAVISQTSLLQLPLTPIPQLALYITWIMFGLRCLLPFSTSLYCILDTVVSFKTRLALGSGKIIRAQRVFVSIFVTLTALYIIATVVLPLEYFSEFSIIEKILGYITPYYQYVYWAFEGLVVFFIIGYAHEFSHIAMCCGCFKAGCCKRRKSNRIVPINDDGFAPV